MVAPVVGALICREAKSNRPFVEKAAELIRGQFSASEQAHSRLRRCLNAWLDVELAAACWSEGDRVSAVGFMMRSMWHVPRLGIQLRKWWRIELPLVSRDYSETRLGRHLNRPHSYSSARSKWGRFHLKRSDAEANTARGAIQTIAAKRGMCGQSSKAD